MKQQSLETVACDFCSSNEQVDILTRPVGLSVGECAECGLAYVNPRPTWEAMLAHYESSYVADKAEARWAAYRLSDMPWIDVRRIKQHLDIRGTKVLDVGCGSGVFLDALRRAGAVELVGIEPGANAARSARRMLPEAKILEAPYETAHIGETQFDLICAINLIEHLYIPTQFFAFAQRALKPDGLLYIHTPNWGAAKKHGIHWRGLQVDYEHVYYFDQHTLMSYLNKYGLNVISISYDPLTGGLGSAQAFVSQNDQTNPGCATAPLLNGMRVLSTVPTLSRLFYRLLYFFRRAWNINAIQEGTAHVLSVLAEKCGANGYSETNVC
jgi:2-polyprenyl-3-methyl-5-hydroxy-6-metoxy-1,4-benzoquinol methylase